MLETIVASTVILLGAVVMLASIVRSRELLRVTPLISSRSRTSIVHLLRIHRGLMTFFLVGYVVVAAAFLLDIRPVGRLFVGAIFFFGATFVLMGIHLQARMLSGLQQTIHGIVPICSKCRKIRIAGSDPSDRASWKTIESYMAESADADFAHGMCPECLDSLFPDYRRYGR